MVLEVRTEEGVMSDKDKDLSSICTPCTLEYLKGWNAAIETAIILLESDEIKEKYSSWCMGPDEAADEVRALKNNKAM